MIFRIAIVSASAIGLAASQPKAAPEASQRTGVNRAPDPPKGSIEIKPGVWEHRDEKGQVWWYRRTPFGLAKLPPNDNADNTEIDKREAAYLKAMEDGDTVKFERRTPFGVSRWTRKKSELKGAELQAWKRVEAAKTSAKK